MTIIEGESIEVVPSAEGENGLPPAPAPAPSPQPAATPATPAAPTEPATPAEAPLFELPDGRKVDAETLTKEWKENFLPDYTRKSQELAAKNTPPATVPLTTPPTNPLADPNWQPSSYAELIGIAKTEMMADLEAKEKARIDANLAIENEVTAQLDSIKKIDPTLNENALFQHATKYGFRDLRQAHQNMKDMSEVIKKTQTTTAQNIAKRNDPVSASPGATGARPDPSSFASAAEFLRSLK